MGRKAKAPARLEGWRRLQESGGKGKNFRTWDMSLDLTYGGMSFGELRDEMERVEREYGDQFEKFKIEVELEYEPYSCNDEKYARTYVLGWRKETDEEYEARLAKAAEIQAAREARERAEFERLAKKFAGE